MLSRLTAIALVPLAVLLCGCDLLGGDGQAQVEREVLTKLNLLQIAIEELVPDTANGAEEAAPPAAPAVAVVAVVDSYFLDTALAEDVEDDAGDAADARRRERIVRQELNNRFVENTLIEVVQPGQDNVQQARDEIISANSAALDAVSTLEIGQALGVDVLVCVLIDEAGDEVNVVALRTLEGKLIYQDTILHWELVVQAGEQPATGEE